MQVYDMTKLQAWGKVVVKAVPTQNKGARSFQHGLPITVGRFSVLERWYLRTPVPRTACI